MLQAKGARTVAVTCTTKNQMQRAAHSSVHLPLERELCPFDLAPVTSTAVQVRASPLPTVRRAALCRYCQLRAPVGLLLFGWCTAVVHVAETCASGSTCLLIAAVICC